MCMRNRQFAGTCTVSAYLIQVKYITFLLVDRPTTIPDVAAFYAYSDKNPLTAAAAAVSRPGISYNS